MSSADLTLLARWLDHRDAQAFKELTSKHAPKVYATCKRILGNAAEAEDATQECFAKLAGARKSPTGNLGAWLHRVATNQALDRIRMEKRRQRRETEFIAKRPAHTEATWDDLSGFVDQAIADLPERLRIPIVELFLNDRSHVEIAKELGVSRQTVTHRVEKGVDAIRKALRRKGIVVTATALTALLRGNMAEAATLPPTLAGSLGKLALAGPPVSAGAAAVVSLFTAWKMAAVGAAALAIAVAAPVVYTRLASPSNKPGDAPASNAAGILPAQEFSADQESALSPEQGPRDKTLQDTGASVPGGVPSIVGRVYDAETGRGVPDVHVDAANDSDGSRVFIQTDTAGRFVFAGLHEGSYTLSWLNARGFPCPQDRDAKTVIVEPDEAAEVEFALEKGLSVTGVVVDVAGKPVGDADVYGETNRNMTRQYARSGVDGAFTLLGFAAGDQVTLRAGKSIEHEERLRSYPCEALDVGENGLHDLVIVAHELSSISGKVVDPAGKPVSRVYVQAAAEQFLVAPPSEQRREAMTGAFSEEDGAFRIASLFAGTWQVGFKTTGTQQVVKTVPGEEVKGITLVFTGELPKSLTQAGSFAISGRVSTLEGNPLADVYVHAYGDSEKTRLSRGTACTDEAGLFSIEGLSDGPHLLRVQHPAYHAAEQAGIAAGTRSVHIQLTRRPRIEGRVVRAETGEALADFLVGTYSVEAVEHLNLESPLVLELLTLIQPQNVHDPDGRFMLENMECGDAYVLARAEGYGPEFARVTLPTSGENPAPVTIELKPEARVEGRVVTEQNKAVEGAFIFRHDLHDSRMEAETTKLLAMARSDSNGAFAAGGLPGGSLSLSAYHPDYPIAACEISLTQGATVPMTIVLQSAGLVQGTVSLGGKPLAGQRVALYPQEGRADHATTSEQGTYQFSGVESGEVKIQASLEPFDKLLDGSPRTARSLTRTAIIEGVRTTTVDFDFAPADSRLEGTISLEGQVPKTVLVDLEVTTPAGDVERFEREVFTGDGVYHFDSLPPGQARLRVLALAGNEKRTALHEVTLEAGKTVSFDIDFSGGCVLDGTVSGQAPYEQCGLCLYSDRVSSEKLAKILGTLDGVVGEADASTAVTGDGAFHVEGLLSGTYTAVVFCSDSRATDEDERIKSVRHAIAPVTVTDRQTTTLHIGLE